jgi:energy-coupling factor transport system substrate-specific component
MNLRNKEKKMIDRDKISAKDLITIAIFSAIFYLIMRLASFAALIIFLYPFVPAIEILLCGSVWVYLRKKVPKPFCILIQCTTISLLAFVTGTIWTIPLGILSGGIAAELISRLGEYKNFKISIVAYAAYGLCFNFGVFGVILMAGDYWRNYVSEMGMDSGGVDAIINLISWPIFLLSCTFVVLGSVLGTWIGRLILKKHFIKAGLA